MVPHPAFKPEATAPAPAAGSVSRSSPTWRAYSALAAIAGLSLYLGLKNISQQGFANYYYAAAVRSMMQNWHAFYFASLDSKGFVSIDKPPLGFWIQTLSAWFFGYHGWSLLLPQALAAAGSTVLLFAIVRRFFGVAAGLLAALALAISPINVAVSRNNTPDGLLIFCLLLAVECFCRAVATKRARWLVAAFALVGVGFNIKMLEAYLVLPAMVVVYLLVEGISFRRKIGNLIVGGFAMAAISFAWATSVWLTPASQRPYVGSTKNNNIFSLIFGYNGINRLMPKGWSIFGITNGSPSVSTDRSSVVSASLARVSEAGPQGWLRLFDRQLGGQIGWLIPISLMGLVVAWGKPKRRRLDDRHAILAVFALWGCTEAGFFSFAGFYHRYYLATLSPELAALTGIGIVALWQTFQRSGWRAALLPAALALAAAIQLRLLAPYGLWRDRIGDVLVVAGMLAAGFCFVRWSMSRFRLDTPRQTSALSLAAGACLTTLLIAPAIWSFVTLNRGYLGALPVAGPNPSVATSTRHASKGQQASVDAIATTAKTTDHRLPKPRATDSGAVMMRYLIAHRGKADYVVAVPSSREADPIIVDTGEPVMTLGGFGGSDPILSVKQLKHLVAARKIRFFLDMGADAALGVVFDASGKANLTSILLHQDETSADDISITTWVEQSCRAVPPTEIAAAAPGASIVGLDGLYDCSKPTN